MSVSARLYVAEVTRYPGAEPTGKVILRAAANAENKEWAAATPVASFELSVNSAALDQFDAWRRDKLDIDIMMTPRVAVDGEPAAS